MSDEEKTVIEYKAKEEGINIHLKMECKDNLADKLFSVFDAITKKYKQIVRSPLNKHNEGSMCGSVISNSFEVRNANEFFDWFTNSVFYGNSITLRQNGTTFSFSGIVRNPSAHPYQIFEEQSEMVPWDLAKFASEVRKHLDKNQEFRVLATGNDQEDTPNRVTAMHLIISHDSWDYNTYSEGE